jgi:hypothetical protein
MVDGPGCQADEVQVVERKDKEEEIVYWYTTSQQSSSGTCKRVCMCTGALRADT